MRKLPRRAGVALLVLLFLLGLRLALPWAARVLIVEDALAPADAILVLASSRIERVYEAGALYREKQAPRILLSKPSNEENAALARSLGVRIPSHNDLQRTALEQMGVPPAAIENMEARMSSTHDEARVLAKLANQRKYRRVIVATSSYHTRRARHYLRRAAKGRFQIVMRPTRYDSINPARWWRRPNDRVDVILEWLKLPRVVWTSMRS